jgi:predicted nucleic acid-binding protein
VIDDNIIVLDNSINSRLLWPDSADPENNQYALHIIQQAEQNAVFYVPTIWHYELTQVAYKLTKSGEITQADAQNYFNLTALLPIKTDLSSHGDCSVSTFSLSLQYNLSVYDSAYLELSLRLGAPLASNDKGLKKAADKAGVVIFE